MLPVIADVSKTLPTLTLEERGGTPDETLRKGATISLDDIRSHDRTGRRWRRDGQ
jgi:hypothetical protein